MDNSEKIDVLFGHLCSTFKEDDSLVTLLLLCKHKRWSEIYRIFTTDEISTSGSGDIDNKQAEILIILGFLSKMYSQISVSMPESTSPKISKFCPGDSGAPIYLEQDGKEVVAGVLSFVEPPKMPAYPGDRFKDIKQGIFVISQVVKRLFNKKCSVLASAVYLFPHIPWINETKTEALLIKKTHDS